MIIFDVKIVVLFFCNNLGFFRKIAPPFNIYLGQPGLSTDRRETTNAGSQCSAAPSERDSDLKDFFGDTFLGNSQLGKWNNCCQFDFQNVFLRLALTLSRNLFRFTDYLDTEAEKKIFIKWSTSKKTKTAFIFLMPIGLL